MPELKKYARKRDLHRTPEPAGTGKRHHRGNGHAYVIQKHDARNLHYDLRLELDGVLLSWAVPKGPSLDPSTKRLAMQTEAHPIEYRHFEGVIPKGQYGGGTVMVWDQGSWEPLGDAHRGYRKGHLKFRLHGEKLAGAWHLVRRGEGKSWLLFKARDEHAKREDGPTLLATRPESALTGRDLASIADDPERVWDSKAAKKKQPRSVETRASKGAEVRLTSPDRVLYREMGFTKRDLADYYLTIAPWMMPHVKHRILTLVRCPDGYHEQCFYQKHVKQGMPAHIRSAPVREKNKTVNYVRIDDVQGLLSLVQLGVLEIHTWGARADRPERPDQLVFDLDPGAGTDWGHVVEGSRKVRERLGELGLESFLKTSGSKGLHVVVPVQRRLGWDETKAFCKAIADGLVRDEPDKYVATSSKSKRRGKLFVDYLRNAKGATTVCAYSTRARAGAPVSTPVAWEELSSRLRPDQFDIKNLPPRLVSSRIDPWAGFFEIKQSITKQMRRAVGLI